MPDIIVETGMVVSGANSFVSLATADNYHGVHGNTAWVAADQTDREAALIRAGRYLNGLTWKGRRTARTNAMAWPRYGVIDDESWAVNSDEVPFEVSFAQCEAALRELASPGCLLPDAARGDAVRKEKLGELQVEYEPGAAPGQRFNVLESLLRGLLRAGHSLALERE